RPALAIGANRVVHLDEVWFHDSGITSCGAPGASAGVGGWPGPFVDWSGERSPVTAGLIVRFAEDMSEIRPVVHRDGGRYISLIGANASSKSRPLAAPAVDPTVIARFVPALAGIPQSLAPRSGPTPR